MENEKLIKENTPIIPVKELYNLIELSKKIMCKLSYIDSGNSYTASGFFIKLNILNLDKHLFLMTNHHVLNENFFKNNEELKFEHNNEHKTLNNLKHRKIFLNEELDFCIIEIFSSDNIFEFLELEPNMSSFEIYINKEIFIPQFPLGNGLSISLGNIINTENFYLYYSASTQKTSSGSPIISRNTLRVIGLHKGAFKEKNYNFGIFIKNIINYIETGKYSIKNLILYKTIQNNSRQIILLNDRKSLLI